MAKCATQATPGRGDDKKETENSMTEKQNGRVTNPAFDKRLARTESVPTWLRIVHAANCETDENGVAQFGHWENLAAYIKPEGHSAPDKSTIYKATKKAVANGLLHRDSEPSRLVFYPEDVSTVDESATHEDWKTVLDEDIEFESEGVDNVATQDDGENRAGIDVEAWFNSEDVSETSKMVAAYGLQFRKTEPKARVLAVAQEATKPDYECWGNAWNMRYTYASQEITGFFENDRERQKEESW